MAKQSMITTVSLDEDDRQALEEVRDALIQPFFGKHNQTQAIAYCIRFTHQHGVVEKLVKRAI
jgi:hypothetical protein